MTDETDLGAFEMLWDCPACGTAKLLGKSQRFCPSCGAAQDPKTRYFPSDEDKIAVRDHEFFGADVVCPACDVPNSKNAAHCVACGADLAKGKEASIRGEQAVASGAAFGKETAKDAKTEHKNARLAREAAMQGKPPPNAPPPAKKFYQSKGFLIVAGIVFALVCTLLVLLFWKKEATVIVTGHQWKRVVGVEKFAPKNESAWCDSVPGDAYALSRKSEVRSQKKIADGKTCKTVRKDRGDGTFKETEKCETKYRDEPVYDNKCYFQVNR